MRASILRRTSLICWLVAVLLPLVACIEVSQRADPAPALPTERYLPQPPARDVEFCQHMGVHHEQAVRMTGLVQGRGTPAVQALATTIELAQTQEIGVMRGWLQLWGAPQLPAAAPGSDQGHNGHQRHGTPTMHVEQVMPGMATETQLARLPNLRGPQFDELFLRLMIRHHRGGISMAQELLGQGGGGLQAVEQIAQLMIWDQMLEIGQMNRLLLGHGLSPSDSASPSAGTATRESPKHQLYN